MEVPPGNAPGSFLHTNKNQMKSDVGRTNCCNRFSRDTANWKAVTSSRHQNGDRLWCGLPRIAPEIFLLHGGRFASVLHRQYHRLSNGYTSTLHDYLSCGNVSIRLVITGIALMHSLREFFFPSMCSTIRASLACSSRVNESKIDPTLPTYPLEDIEETTPGRI